MNDWWLMIWLFIDDKIDRVLCLNQFQNIIFDFSKNFRKKKYNVIVNIHEN